MAMSTRSHFITQPCIGKSIRQQQIYLHSCVQHSVLIFLLQFYQKIHGAFYTNVTTVKIEIMYGVYQPVSQFPPSPLFVCMPDEVEADATKVVIGL